MKSIEESTYKRSIKILKVFFIYNPECEKKYVK